MRNQIVPKSILQAPVVDMVAVAQQTVRLTLFAPEWAREAHAGHFISILVAQCGDVLWRRPFSVHRVDRAKGTIDILIAAIGRGSQAISKCQPGDKLDVLGLLGNTFPIASDLREMIIVAGGIGIAPFDLLLQDAASLPIKKSLFYGARSAALLCSTAEWSKSGVDVHISTDDGSAGHKGLVLDELRRYLDQESGVSGRMIYSCGPTPMLAGLRKLTMSRGVKAVVTVENLMACGFGACVGCPVELAEPRREDQKYLLACKDGPVFSLEEILLHD
jgi:dihydroorotate dehydrogenase electron transfer subunit